MQKKKPVEPKVRDLRDTVPVKGAVPDVSGELAGAEPTQASDGPNIVSPGIGHEPPGQGTSD